MSWAGNILEAVFKGRNIVTLHMPKLKEKDIYNHIKDTATRKLYQEINYYKKFKGGKELLKTAKDKLAILLLMEDVVNGIF